MSDEAIGIAAEIRCALLAADAPLSVADIFAACDSASNTTQVAGVMNTEYAAARVNRIGSPGSYRYALTDSGRACAQDPRLLRSRSNRRVRGRPLPPLAKQAAGQAAAAAEAPAQPDSSPEGLDAAGWVEPSRIADAIKSAPTVAKTDITARENGRPAGAAAPDERSARLAAVVLACWPSPISSMPPELRHAVQASLAPMLTA